jgi:transcription elongation factor Elf1
VRFFVSCSFTPHDHFRAFRHILKKDRADHGTDDYQLEETVDTFQQDVDEVVEATALAKKEEDNESEEEGEEDEE